jgi:hypothetical protein
MSRVTDRGGGAPALLVGERLPPDHGRSGRRRDVPLLFAMRAVRLFAYGITSVVRAAAGLDEVRIRLLSFLLTTRARSSRPAGHAGGRNRTLLLGRGADTSTWR